MKPKYIELAERMDTGSLHEHVKSELTIAACRLMRGTGKKLEDYPEAIVSIMASAEASIRITAYNQQR